MDHRTISAYDLPHRVASYDADMELMHPNRATMVRVTLEVLPFSRHAPLQALDLGIGTGYFTERFLSHFPQSSVVAVDGARAMIELAKERLGTLAARVEFRIGDFRHLKHLVPGAELFDVVFSSYALHHLSRDDKQTVVGQALALLRPDGWFLNADILVADSPEIERRIQDLRVRGIVHRAAGNDPRFKDELSTRRFLDELEANDGDQPQTLLEDLRILQSAGLRGTSVFWLQYREAVCGGQK